MKLKDNLRVFRWDFMKILLLSFLIFSSFSISAGVQTEENCSNLDIREINPKIKDNPVVKEHYSSPRNQDSIGWCYAFVAADLLTAEVGTSVSSAHVSALYNKNTQSNNSLRKREEKRRSVDPVLAFKSVFEGGFVDDAIELVSKNKFICPEVSFPFDLKHREQTLEFIKKIEEYKLAGISSSEEACQDIERYITEITNASLDAKKVAQNLLFKDLNLSLEEMATESCKNNLISVPKLKTKRLNLRKNPTSQKFANFLNTINQKLEKGRPLGLSYEVKHYTVLDGSHASIITGRRWKNGQCEYKIRNSWGQSCASYKEGIDCEKKEGSFWVSDESLATSADSIEYIDA